jgi:hypothetical protein
MRYNTIVHHLGYPVVSEEQGVHWIRHGTWGRVSIVRGTKQSRANFSCAVPPWQPPCG